MRKSMTRLKLKNLIRIAVILIAFGHAYAAAHEGPPFPILMDVPLSGQKVSIWADPDIGEAKFFVVVEELDGGIPAEVPTVSMWTEPVNGRLQRETYPSEFQSLRSHLQFEVRPAFDIRDQWRIGVEMTMPGAEAETVTAEVESTPPGYGAWDLAIYLFPFLLVGGMWVCAMLRHRKTWRDQLRKSSAAPLGIAFCTTTPQTETGRNA